MTYSKQQNQTSAAISEDKMDSIVDAILEGQYSYACLILLEETGHDPVQYIPYRTYNRLQKQRQMNHLAKRQVMAKSIAKSIAQVSELRCKKSEIAIADIDYVETLHPTYDVVSGGKGYTQNGEIRHRQAWNEYASSNIIFWPRRPSA